MSIRWNIVIGIIGIIIIAVVGTFVVFPELKAQSNNVDRNDMLCTDICSSIGTQYFRISLGNDNNLFCQCLSHDGVKDIYCQSCDRNAYKGI